MSLCDISLQFLINRLSGFTTFLTNQHGMGYKIEKCCRLVVNIIVYSIEEKYVHRLDDSTSTQVISGASVGLCEVFFLCVIELFMFVHVLF